MTFSVDLARYIAKTNQRAADVQAAVGLQLAEKIITRTPVDTGRARGNWNIEIDRINERVSNSRTQQDALNEARANAREFYPGDILYITNGLPYIRRLEYGSSRQAPQGIVRITAEEFQQAVREALNGA